MAKRTTKNQKQKKKKKYTKKKKKCGIKQKKSIIKTINIYIITIKEPQWDFLLGTQFCIGCTCISIVCSLDPDVRGEVKTQYRIN